VSDQPGAALPPDAPQSAAQSEPAPPQGAYGPASTATEPAVTTEPAAPTAPAAPTGLADSTGLADGEWHRLHPATPLLRGGIALLAVLGVVINSLRERLIEMFTGRGQMEGDPIEWVLSHGYAGIVLGAIAVGLIVFVAGFYLSWRMHTFRITNEVVEVRSGILFRTNRRGRLDRIQGINIVRPLIARIFGAAKLEVNVAGQDANVQLAYLSSRHADDLRRDVLRLASGTQQTDNTAVQRGPQGNIIDQRVSEFLAPELDPNLAPPESVVKMNTGRLLGSIALNDTTIVFLLLLVGAAITTWVIGEPFLLFTLFPVLIGLGSYLVSRFTKSLRYSIAGTPDGVRVGFGLFTTSNETLPPGRIHSIQVSQPLLWRGPGWWEIKVNRASQSSTQGASGQQNTTILPVGNLDDVMRVLELLLPSAPVVVTAAPGNEPVAHELLAENSLIQDDAAAATASAEASESSTTASSITSATATDATATPGAEATVVPALPPVELLHRGLVSKGGDDGFTNSPPRAVALRWFSGKRNGYAFSPGAVLFRKGRIWRELVIVPEPRVQSVALQQGPLMRRLRLAAITLHTVAGPITARLGAVDHKDALDFFETASRSIVESASTDTSHRWRSGENAAQPVALPVDEPADQPVDPQVAPLVVEPFTQSTGGRHVSDEPVGDERSTENQTNNHTGEVSP
jgi:putative membrane protein